MTAVQEGNNEILKAAFSDYKLLEARSMLEAEFFVDHFDIALFVIEIHFDESRATELVNIIRKNPKTRKAPILMLRLSRSELASEIRQLMASMKTLANITDYVEVEDNTRASTEIRHSFDKHFTSGKHRYQERQPF